MDFVDTPQTTRPGEELDLVAVKAYLGSELPDLAGEIEVLQFPSGYSNLTYMLKIGDKELVLRRPPFGSKVKSAHDMGREYKILSRLSKVYACAPKPLVYCEDESVIGAKFYVMERIPGIILRKELPPGMTITPEQMTGLSESFIDNLALIHSFDYNEIGLGDLGKPEGFLGRQVDGWARRYEGSQTDEIPEIERAVTWLKAEMPESPPATLIHNDYKYDNIILDPGDCTRIIGVLDWEMSTIGDPLLDLGVALGYWVQGDDPPELLSQGFGPTHMPGSLTRQQLLDRYVEKTGRDATNIKYYMTFAMFKLAVVIQQIYYRFVKGHTQDDRFAGLMEMIKILARSADEFRDRDHI